ncbi:ABC transporter permease [Streptomyces rimosus]|uniref:ABC transporter permease n=1 Tax=Streptomyces rimosus TaxID=1927 RepID=UPI0004C067F1|nr:ABC transporter permease [Streptomyces rimosus]
MLTRHYIFFELGRLRRDPKFVVLTVAVPAMLYLLISTTGHKAATGGADAGVMAGMACYGVLMVTITNGVNVTLDRNIGWIAQLRTTPLRAPQILIGKAVSGLLLSLLSLLAIFLIGGLAQGVELSGTQWLEIGAIIWLGSLPFALLGMALGFLTSPTTGGPAVMACVIGMSALGGLWIPTRLFPDTLQHISKALPTSRWAHLSQALLDGGASPLSDLLVLGGWTLGFALLAGFAFRRDAAH